MDARMNGCSRSRATTSSHDRAAQRRESPTYVVGDRAPPLAPAQHPTSNRLVDIRECLPFAGEEFLRVFTTGDEGAHGRRRRSSSVVLSFMPTTDVSAVPRRDRDPTCSIGRRFRDRSRANRHSPSARGPPLASAPTALAWSSPSPRRVVEAFPRLRALRFRSGCLVDRPGSRPRELPVRSTDEIPLDIGSASATPLLRAGSRPVIDSDDEATVLRIDCDEVPAGWRAPRIWRGQLSRFTPSLSIADSA